MLRNNEPSKARIIHIMRRDFASADYRTERGRWTSFKAQCGRYVARDSVIAYRSDIHDMNHARICRQCN